MKKKKVSKLTTKTQLGIVQTKYETLVNIVNAYVSALKAVKVQTAGVYPAYGKKGEENNPTKSAPNVVFIKDLINQVETAKALGYNTLLKSFEGELFVEFTEKVPYVPRGMQYLTLA